MRATLDRAAARTRATTQRLRLGERGRAPAARPLVPPVRNQDARDPVQVRPAYLRDDAGPHRLPHQLLLERRVLLPAPLQDRDDPRRRPPYRLLDRQPVDPALRSAERF